ncbi:tagatose-bisphosphate aldolase [Heyndrickxia vini]|uniref:Tagatose 1,6-diphosphate aldolase n=1 Tax=Heyndrickxia vini TaxID=1476025 RepID=A0ABX7E438_9BACI|nr:tagatose-bisphosphate aldolase [Heyndrickxia vini]QQZ10080.1 tagatose-bisphosphate aldolase [Heyndrickxia vini]
MRAISENKRKALLNLTNEQGIISALAIDQRGALKKMMGENGTQEAIEEFKMLVSEILTPYASSILLDPEYGLPAASKRNANAGLLIAYEKTGYDATKPGRFPDLLPIWSARRIKEAGADAVKFLLYYDIDEPAEINDQKHAFVERLGSECVAEDIPFFLELVSYDSKIEDVKSKAYAKVKPHKVNDMMVEFSKPQYHVDVLKVEVPVNMDYVEGYGTEAVYTKEEALGYFKAQSESTDIPFIFLSAGVSAEMFQETLRFAHEAGSNFNGVLCGRATWKDGVKVYTDYGADKAKEWMQTHGKANIEALNQVIQQTASSCFEKIK